MSSRERPTDRSSRLLRRAVRAAGDELRGARLNAGLSQRAVARAAGLAHSQVGRLERGEAAPSLDHLFRCAVVLGLDPVLRFYPAGDALRDAGHVRLIARFRARLGPGVRLATEVPLPTEGDRRAWDGLITCGNGRVGVEAETRLNDLQALQRRVALKARDGRVDQVILLVADTAHNRRVLRAAGAQLTDAFPVPQREALAALSAGRASGSAIVVL